MYLYSCQMFLISLLIFPGFIFLLLVITLYLLAKNESPQWLHASLCKNTLLNYSSKSDLSLNNFCLGESCGMVLVQHKNSGENNLPHHWIWPVKRKCPWPSDSQRRIAQQQMLVSHLSHLHFDTEAVIVWRLHRTAQASHIKTAAPNDS